MSALKNAAYVAVGFGVIGFQKVQVRRHELTKLGGGVVRAVIDTARTGLRIGGQ